MDWEAKLLESLFAILIQAQQPSIDTWLKDLRSQAQQPYQPGKTPVPSMAS